jgi:lysophospholipase L1-like esterase
MPSVSAQTDKSCILSSYHVEKTSQFQSLPITTGKIIFLGDSITERATLNELIDTNALNRGIGSETTFGVLDRLDEVIRHNPKKIFIMIGVNDISLNSSNENIIKRYTSIVSKLNTELPNTEIYVESVLPVNVKKYGKNLNILISSLNDDIKKMNGKYTYIDLWGTISNNEELLSDVTEDGIHLNGKGYKLWKDAIKYYL